jgi:hypothetical protein
VRPAGVAGPGGAPGGGNEQRSKEGRHGTAAQASAGWQCGQPCGTWGGDEVGQCGGSEWRSGRWREDTGATAVQGQVCGGNFQGQVCGEIFILAACTCACAVV